MSKVYAQPALSSLCCLVPDNVLWKVEPLHYNVAFLHTQLCSKFFCSLSSGLVTCLRNLEHSCSLSVPFHSLSGSPEWSSVSDFIVGA